MTHLLVYFKPKRTRYKLRLNKAPSVLPGTVPPGHITAKPKSRSSVYRTKLLVAKHSQTVLMLLLKPVIIIKLSLVL